MLPRRPRARGLLVLLTAALLATACKRQEEPAPAPPEDEPASTPDGPPADKDVMTYVSGAEHGGAAAPDEDGEDDEAAGEASDEAGAEAADDEVQLEEREAKISTAEEARQLAETAAGEALGYDTSTKVSPALTPTWPPEDLRLIYLVYPMIPVESSMKVKVGRPIRVTVNLEDGGVTTKKKLRESKVLKTLDLKRDSSVVRHNLATAEQALIDVLLRKRSVARSYRLLDGYREWFNENLEFMTDFSHRHPKAMKWFKDPTPSKSMP